RRRVLAFVDQLARLEAVHELLALIVVVAAVHARGGRAALELEVRAVCSRHAPTRIPDLRGAADAVHQAAADRSHQVELVTTLPPEDAAAPFGGELFRRARAVQPVLVAPVVHHAQL